MVQGAGLEPAISKLSVWGLTNLATLTYDGAFYLSMQAPNAGRLKPFPNKTITGFFFASAVLSYVASNCVYGSFGLTD